MSSERVIWKYPIFGLRIKLNLQNPNVVFVGLDPESNKPAVWIEHDKTEETNYSLEFVIVGTGHSLPVNENREYYKHVGSVIDREYVWHIYLNEKRE